MLPELPPNIRLSPGRLEILARTAERMAEALYTLALVMQNDQRWAELVEPAPEPPQTEEDELEGWLEGLRARHAGQATERGVSRE